MYPSRILYHSGGVLRVWSRSISDGAQPRRHGRVPVIIFATVAFGSERSSSPGIPPLWPSLSDMVVSVYGVGAPGGRDEGGRQSGGRSARFQIRLVDASLFDLNSHVGASPLASCSSSLPVLSVISSRSTRSTPSRFCRSSRGSRSLCGYSGGWSTRVSSLARMGI